MVQLCVGVLHAMTCSVLRNLNSLTVMVLLLSYLMHVSSHSINLTTWFRHNSLLQTSYDILLWDDYDLIVMRMTWTWWLLTIETPLKRPLFLNRLLHIREVPGSMLGPGDRLLWLRFSVDFLSPSRLMPGYYLKIRPRSLPTRSFVIHHHSHFL
jgi:hypothetical protein